MGGVSTPLSMAGMVTLMNAEWLAACVLAQMSKAGTEQIYNFLPVFADMRDGAYAPGAIEVGMVISALCQMARFYKVPSGGYLGLTNAKIPDAQAGFEKGMSPLLGAVSGVDFIVMGGSQDALMAFDFGQLVIDSEIAQMVKAVAAGLASPGKVSRLRKSRRPVRRACLPTIRQRWNACTRQPSCLNWQTGSCANSGKTRAPLPSSNAP